MHNDPTGAIAKLFASARQERDAVPSILFDPPRRSNPPLRRRRWLGLL